MNSILTLQITNEWAILATPAPVLRLGIKILKESKIGI